MASKIPHHHVRQSVCATRPPYREGRHPKAVKVYTVNNESCYILIQGVPSVGALQELSKLCTSFGAVEQFSALDDYPCDDKYTEVYLVKYKKIQSARFSKRKLDDHSFFGGTLHVCYAPEYETVNETKEKLQERRRAVASRIKQLATDNTVQQVPSRSNFESPVLHSQASILDTQLLSLEVPPSSSGSDLSSSSVVPKFDDRVTQSQSPAVDSSQSAVASANKATDEILTFELPLPPKVEHSSRPNQDRQRHKYEFSRVPSSHATLPAGYDARLSENVSKEYLHSNNVQENVSSASGTQGKKPASLPPNQKKLPHASSSSRIIVKDYKPSRATPQFVPRQALKRKADKSVEVTVAPQKNNDSLDQEIRKNAFNLGDIQGPTDVHNRKREIPTSAQQSVRETISEIRSKISKVIKEGMKKQQ